jgi:hypothetical protein
MTGSAQRILHHAVVEKLVMAPSWCRSPRAAQGPLPRCDAMLDWFRSKSGPSTFRSGQSRPEISEKMKFGKRESEARAGKGKKEAGILLTSEYSFGRACFTGSLAGSWGPGFVSMRTNRRPQRGGGGERWGRLCIAVLYCCIRRGGTRTQLRKKSKSGSVMMFCFEHLPKFSATCDLF